MKRLYLLFIFFIISISINAQIEDGYYRVQNEYSERYIVVASNKAIVNKYTNEVDLGSIETYKPFDKIVSNPASIIYIESHGNNQYVLKAQGTDTKSMTGYFLKIRDNKNGTYMAYATVSGITKYLSDEATKLSDGILMTSGSKARNWYIKPVNSDNNYFGLSPELSIGSDFFTTIYASFPFGFASEGIQAYYISKVDIERNVAVYKEIKDVVPAATPVFIKCSSAMPINNKLNILLNAGGTPNDNLLKGVYFNNNNSLYRNQVAYDATTMRVLGKTSDGSLGFVTASIDYLPANKAYLKVPVAAPSELRLMSEEEYTTGIDDVLIDSDVKKSGIYTIMGVKLDEKIKEFPSGVYIINGKKVVLK